MFGITPEQGRLFISQDQQNEQGHLVVLSDNTWRTRFGLSPSVVGQTISLDKQSYTVIGVAARDFSYPQKTFAWTPLFVPIPERTNPTSFYYQVLSKLRPGANVAQVSAQLKTIADRIAKDNPVLQKGYDIVATPMLEQRVGNIRQAYLILLAAATFVLLMPAPISPAFCSAVECIASAKWHCAPHWARLAEGSPVRCSSKVACSL